MPKPSSVEAALDRLVALRADPAGVGVPDELTRALAHRSEIVVSKAVQLAGEFRLISLKPQLVETFTRFLTDPKSPDRGCEIKKAIVKTLFELGLNDPDVVQRIYLPGVCVTQKEWNDDVAAPLRGFCAMGLAAAGYKDVLAVLSDLLADIWPAARVGAARALAFTGQDSAALLLRLKLILTDGDSDSDAAAECMNALVQLWPSRSTEFLVRFLHHSSEINRTAAALALGASRQPAAFEALRACLQRETDADCRQVLLLALATMRLPQAVDCVLDAAGSGNSATVIAAIDALALYRHDDAVRSRLKAAIEGRGEDIQRAFKKTFGN